MQAATASSNRTRPTFSLSRAGWLALIALLLLWRCATAGTEDLFIPPRTVHDPDRDVIWALRDGLIMRYDAQRRTLLDSFSLPDWSMAIRSESCEPDMALDEKGNLFVSSNADNPLWRIDARSLKVERIELALDSDADKDLGFTGLYPAAPGVLLAVSSIHGSLWRIDLASRKAQKLPLARPLRGACALGLAAERGKPLPQSPARGAITLCAPSRKAGYVIRLTDLRQAELLPGNCAQAAVLHGWRQP